MNTRPSDPPANTVSSDTLARLRALFDCVIELSSDERLIWLDQQLANPQERAAVLSLLHAHDADQGVLDTPAGELAGRMKTDGAVLEGLVGQTIGSFRLVRLLGKGGMAAVFLGQRQAGDFEQQVAIKLLRRGLYSELEQRLFLRERQVLANLSHPNIARLFDGDVTPAGIPFLVMEYIDGVPITQYTKAHQLDVRQRLALLLTVLRAVDVAHRSLVVHRDLKPSNIMVDADGNVKLIDFGIAKLLEDEVDQATVGVYTPDYAAPEQVTGQPITTATDVYSLGVVMHELLLGLRPQGTPHRRPSVLAAELALANDNELEAALPMRAMRPALQGDLDNIVLKALSIEADRRYPSAGAFADDIQRYLDRQPVLAHPPSPWYRARKFVARHRGGVLTSAAFVIAIVGAMTLALWQANVARLEAIRADAQAQRAISVRDFMVSLFDAAKLKIDKDEQPTPAQLVKAARERVETDTKMPLSTRADVLATLGEVSMVNGDQQGALDLMDRSIALKQQIYAESDPELWSTQVQRANVLQRLGRFKETLQPLKDLLEHFRADNGQRGIEGLQMLTSSLIRNGEVDAAIATSREAASKAANALDLDPLARMYMRAYPAMTMIFAGRYAEGAPELDTVLQEWRASGLAQGTDYARIASNLAVAKVGLGDPVGAEHVLTEVTTIQQKLNPERGENAIALRNLALVRIQLGMYDAAKPALQEAQTLDEARFPEGSLGRATAWWSNATLEYAQGQNDAAERSLQATLRLCKEPGGDTDDRCANAHLLRGLLMLRVGRFNEADAEITQALEQRIRVFGNSHAGVAAGYAMQADLALARDDATKALQLSEQALGILSEKKADRGHAALIAGIVHANALLQANRAGEARSEIEAMIADWDQRMPYPTPQQFDLFALHAVALAATSEHALALAEAQRALALGLSPAALNDSLLNRLTVLLEERHRD